MWRHGHSFERRSTAGARSALKRLDMPTARSRHRRKAGDHAEVRPSPSAPVPRALRRRSHVLRAGLHPGPLRRRPGCRQGAGRARSWTGHHLRRCNPIGPRPFLFGQFDECLQQVSGAFAEALQRPGTGNSMLLRALCCAAAICGDRGDHAAAAEWWPQADAVASARHRKEFFIKMMRADVLLHHGRRQAAAELSAEPPSALVSPWRGW